MGNFLVWKQSSSSSSLEAAEAAVDVEEQEKKDPSSVGIKIVAISDTHNDHRSFNLIPDGDILIHAGDFTNFGKIEHASDFNEWLGTLPHQVKIVVFGNHESNSPWHKQAKQILSNAVVLIDEYIDVKIKEKCLRIFGTSFYWPMQVGCKNPAFDLITKDIDVLVCHGPVKGCVDGNTGCPALRQRIEEISNMSNKKPQLKLVVSGHIHSAYGMKKVNINGHSMTFINASNCGMGRVITKDPLDITLNI